MSVTLASVADALIEFILSLLRDPEEAMKFNAAPQAVMASKGLDHVQTQDVCAVAPIIAERHDVVQVIQPRIVEHASNNNDSNDAVIREVRNIVNNLSWVDDRDTLIDQSTNQNIWTQGGDVTQTFDQAAVVASGDDAIAAGEDVDIDQTEDNSTNITAGEDANVGNDTTNTEVDGSYNDTSDTSTTTDASTTTTNTDSQNDNSTTDTADDSYNASATEYTEASTDTDSNSVDNSTDTAIIDDANADDGL